MIGTRFLSSILNAIGHRGMGRIGCGTLLVTCIIGCAEKGAGPNVAGSAVADREAGTGLTPEDLRSRLTGADNGLEIRRWTVVDGANVALDALTRHSLQEAVDASTLERLQRNGLLFMCVRAGSVDALLADLGGATTDRNEWHGQVYEWRNLCDTPIDSRGMAVAIDGRVRRFDRGEFRLMLRGWTVMMESGPRLHVELLPQHRVPLANDLRRLLGEHPEDAGEPFPSLALDLQLEAGFAYVLSSVSPATESRGPDSPSAARNRFGPDDSIGPEAMAPMTLGELLLPKSIAPPTREILVLVPRISSDLFPPVYESDAQRTPTAYQRDRTTEDTERGQ